MSDIKLELIDDELKAVNGGATIEKNLNSLYSGTITVTLTNEETPSDAMTALVTKFETENNKTLTDKTITQLTSIASEMTAGNFKTVILTMHYGKITGYSFQ